MSSDDADHMIAAWRPAAVVAFATVRAASAYVYAAMIAMVSPRLLPIHARRRRYRSIGVVSVGVLVRAYSWRGRAARERHGRECPGDNYAIIEAAAWIGLYLVINLQISRWLSSPEDRTPLYWITYVSTWLMPAAGLWIAIRDRHRMLLDVNIVMAIVTLMTNKAYLGTPRQSLRSGCVWRAVDRGRDGRQTVARLRP